MSTHYRIIAICATAALACLFLGILITSREKPYLDSHIAAHSPTGMSEPTIRARARVRPAETSTLSPESVNSLPETLQSLVGRCLDEAGEPVSEVSVTVLNDDSSGRVLGSATSDNNGIFTIAMPEGLQRQSLVHAEHNNYATLVRAVTLDRSGRERVRVPDLILTQGSETTAVLIDDAGSPMVRVKTNWWLCPTPRAMNAQTVLRRGNAQSDEIGRSQLGRMTTGSLYLTVFSETGEFYGTSDAVPIDGDQRSCELEIRIHASHRMLVDIVDDFGNPVDKVTIELLTARQPGVVDSIAQRIGTTSKWAVSVPYDYASVIAFNSPAHLPASYIAAQLETDQRIVLPRMTEGLRVRVMDMNPGRELLVGLGTHECNVPALSHCVVDESGLVVLDARLYRLGQTLRVFVCLTDMSACGVSQMMTQSDLAPDAEPIMVRLEPSSRVTLTCVDEQTSMPVSRALVSLVRDISTMIISESPWGYHAGSLLSKPIPLEEEFVASRADETGTVELFVPRRLSMLVRVEASEYATRVIKVSGRDAEQVKLQRGGGINVTVDGSGGDTEIAAMRLDRRPFLIRPSVKSPAGARFPNLEPGLYMVGAVIDLKWFGSNFHSPKLAELNSLKAVKPVLVQAGTETDVQLGPLSTDSCVSLAVSTGFADVKSFGVDVVPRGLEDIYAAQRPMWMQVPGTLTIGPLTPGDYCVRVFLRDHAALCVLPVEVPAHARVEAKVNAAWAHCRMECGVASYRRRITVLRADGRTEFDATLEPNESNVWCDVAEGSYAVCVFDAAQSPEEGVSCELHLRAGVNVIKVGN